MDEFLRIIPQFKLDEITNTSIDNLNEKITEFKTNKSETNKSEIPNLLFLLINNFNNFLDRNNINNNSDDDNIILKLANILIKIYNGFDDKTKWDKLFPIINNIPNLLAKYLDKVLECYNKIPTEIILSNSVLTYYFAYLIYKCILILYTYYFYIKYIIEYITDKITETNELPPLLDLITANDLSTYIMHHKDNIDYSTKLKCTDKNTNLDCIYIESIYNLIINKFYIDILCFPPDRKIDTISIQLINSKIDSIKSKIESETTDYKKVIYKYIIINHDILELVNSNVINNYITIPQYTGICWFVSMLTGMCYSDASKNLIVSKEKEITDKRDTDIKESEKLFINIVFKILEVSKNFLTYDNNLNNHCDFFKFLKHDLTKYLITKLNEVKKEKANGKNYTKQHLQIGDNEYYYINILNKLLEQNKADKIITNVDKMGITQDGSFILKSLYDILGINTLFIIGSYDNNMYKQKSYTMTDKTPDIIIVESRSEPEKYDLIEKINIMDEITDNDGNEFTYKKSKYILDYKIYSADSTNNVCTLQGCGHCVSSIHYNKIQYYYDSGGAQTVHKCDGEDIRIPCSLIRQDWVNKSIDTSIDKEHFSMNKCFFRNVDIDKNAIHIEYKFNEEDNRVFNKQENVISVYVKEPNITGGKNNTYKSIHKKVNILNNKTKTIIERIIYIDKNKNKFIKFNKNYEPLSNFKYNRKNKYFYM